MGERGIKTSQYFGSPARGAEARNGVVAGQSQHHLRLVVGVLVRAVGIIERQARLILTPVPLDRLLHGGMNLQRQRLLGRDELEQEGQLGAESPHDVLPQQSLRIGSDEVGQGAGAIHEAGGTRCVGAVPLLGPGAAVGALAQQLGNGGRRAPVIGLARTDESFHTGHANPSPATHPGCHID